MISQTELQTRNVYVFMILTLDEVMQGPSGPDEDPRGNFQHGGWAAPFGAMQSNEARESLPQVGRCCLDGYRQRYLCESCQQQFDDLTGTVFQGHHRPMRIWLLCLYFMGLNLSIAQSAAELSLPVNEVQTMTSQLRKGVVVKKACYPERRSRIRQVDITAGHKGQPEVVARLEQPGRRRKLRGRRGRGTLDGEKPSVL